MIDTMFLAIGILMLSVLIVSGFLIFEMEHQKRHKELLKKLEELKK